MTEAVAAEIVPYENEEQEQSLAPVNLFGAESPEAVVERAANAATALKAVAQKKKLVTMIGNKEYPLVEAWTLLGSMLGVFPVTVWTKPIGDGHGWEARVEARTINGAVIGAGEATCDRGERNWKNRDEYALRSMAQTRATSKALRLPLGFIMVLAGYSATPAEEMPQDSGPGSAGKPTEPTAQSQTVEPLGASQAAPVQTESEALERLDRFQYLLDLIDRAKEARLITWPNVAKAISLSGMVKSEKDTPGNFTKLRETSLEVLEAVVERLDLIKRLEG